MAPQADIKAIMTTPQLTNIQMSTLICSLVNIPIQSSNFLAVLIYPDFMESILKQKMIIMIPRTGTLALDPNGIWQVAKGILKSSSTGITIVHMMTNADKIKSQRVSLMWINEIQYRYIANSETEHENVIINTVLGKKFLICFYIRQRVTIRQPRVANRDTIKQKVVAGQLWKA